MKSLFKPCLTRVFALAACALVTSHVCAQGTGSPAAAAAPGRVVVTGTLPDDASKLAILTKLREVYGADKVVDQISISEVAMPPNWATYVQNLISPNLRLINRGQLKVDGNVVNLNGEVASEAQKQKILSDVTAQLNPSYVVNSALRMTASDQGMLDQTLGNRVVEFESGSALLTPNGQHILDEMLTAVRKLGSQKLEIIGHTDDQGLRAANVYLSQARATAVKAYFVQKGLDGALITTSGAGPDRPVASNATGDGRARNRRIEFRLSQ